MNSAYNDPRLVAISALRDRAGNVSAHLDRLMETSPMGGADRGFARELALGTVRRQGTLQGVLRAFLQRPEQPLPGALGAILHLGLYQILLLDRVPVFAAVNEAVSQADHFHLPAHRGMVNGLLRSVARAVSPVQQGTPPLRADVLPLGMNSYRTFDRPIFADPATNPAGYLAAAYSLPGELAARWVKRFGSAQKAVPIAAHSATRAAMILRVNRLKTTVGGAIAALEAQGVQAVPHANGMSVVLPEHANIAALQSFREGLFQPQDATATGVAIACGVQPGMAVLDFCAAPGTKTTHLAELMDNHGSITAVDVSADKLQLIEENCVRLGVGIVTKMLAAEAPAKLAEGSFDVVLADVPCSNTGVLARRAEARWQYCAKRQGELVNDQRFLAVAAAHFVKPGGRLIYSTCSIEPEEDEELSKALAKRGQSRLELLDHKLTLPGGADDPTQWHDGGFIAIFRKK